MTDNRQQGDEVVGRGGSVMVPAADLARVLREVVWLQGTMHKEAAESYGRLKKAVAAHEDIVDAERLIRSWSIGRQVMKALELPLWHKKYLAIREEKGAKAEETQTAKEVLESKIRYFRSLGKNVLRLKELLAAVKVGEEGRRKLREELKQYEF